MLYDSIVLLAEKLLFLSSNECLSTNSFSFMEKFYYSTSTMGLFRKKPKLFSILCHLASSNIRINMAIIFISYSYVGANKKSHILL
jgi:hypothetical protein